MGLAFDSGIINTDVSQTTIFSTTTYEIVNLVALNIICTTPVALSTVTVTVRWHDGIAARAYPVLVLLTTLNNYVNVIFPTISQTYSDVTVEISHTGSGYYRCLICTHDILSV